MVGSAGHPTSASALIICTHHPKGYGFLGVYVARAACGCELLQLFLDIPRACGIKGEYRASLVRRGTRGEGLAVVGGGLVVVVGGGGRGHHRHRHRQLH